MTSQQQQSHVPKFGNWDSGNVPYTAYFENARKERASGAKMINPNDPEENPEAFMSGAWGGGGSDDGVSSAVQAPMSPFRVDAKKLMLAQKQNIEEHQQDSDDEGNTPDHLTRWSRDQFSSEAEIDNKNSGHNRMGSEQEKSITEARNNFSMNPADDSSCRSVALPKFGAWDDMDKASGGGFTVIFNKVKEEKQIAAARFPPVPPQPSKQSNDRKKISGRKICCCPFRRK